MITRKVLAVFAVLLFSTTAFAQANQLRQLATALASETASFADSSYNDYTRAFRNTGNDIEAVMAAQQLAASAQLFNRMVNDRRRYEDLRQAFALLQNAARGAERNNFQRNRWYEVQRLMSDISREVNLGDGGNTGPINPFPFPDGGSSRSGRMTWRGRVDDDIRVVVRGGTAEVETIGGTPYYDAVTNFTNSLPSRRVNVSVVKRRGRGEVFMEQQPSRENGFAAVVRIRDPRGGASDYEFDLSWGQ
jgi:hypothetical protein